MGVGGEGGARLTTALVDSVALVVFDAVGQGCFDFLQSRLFFVGLEAVFHASEAAFAVDFYAEGGGREGAEGEDGFQLHDFDGRVLLGAQIERRWRFGQNMCAFSCLLRKDMLTFDVPLIGKTAYEGSGMSLGVFSVPLNLDSAFECIALTLECSVVGVKLVVSITV